MLELRLEHEDILESWWSASISNVLSHSAFYPTVDGESGEVGKWGSGEVGKWGSGVWGSGEVGRVGKLSHHPITPKPYHPIS
ncbi:MAG UNVERIFIED_CONTAM: hypothetical protein LVR29_31705 [Microcystis novacekii LVE1205-3]